VQLSKSFIFYIIVLFFLIKIAPGQTFENISLVGRWADGPCYAISASGNYVYKGSGSLVYILDTSGEGDPLQVGEVLLPNIAKHIAAFENRLYLTDDDEILYVFDISNPTTPLEIGSLPLGIFVADIIAQGNYIYLGNSNNGLKIYNVSDPTNINEVGVLPDLDVRDLEIKNSNLFVAANTKFSIVDISDPANPLETAFLSFSSHAMTVGTDFAYVAGNKVLRVISVSDPNNPILVGTTTYQGYADAIGYAYNYVFLDDYFDAGGYYLNTIRAYYVGNPENPVETGSFDISGNCKEIYIDDGTVYVAADNAGLYILNAFEFEQVWDSEFTEPCAVTIEGNYAYVVERALTSTLHIYNITDPENPVEIGSCIIEDTGDWLQGITVEGQYAYVAHGQSGLHIIDISNPSTPGKVGGWNDYSECLDVAVEGNYAYIAGADHETWEMGLLTINISNPVNPTLETIKGIATAYDVELKDGYAFVSGNVGLQIFDISDPANPDSVILLSEPTRGYALVLDGTNAYISTDHGIYIYDISDPENPSKIGFYGSGSSDGLEVKGDMVYRAAYDGRFEIFDVSDPTNITEFDNPRMTFPYYTVKFMALKGDYLYCAGESDFRIFRTLNITERYHHASADYTKNVTTSGNYAFVANEQNGLYILDITNPANPDPHGYLDTPGSASNVDVYGNLAGVADNNEGLRIIDISDPASPYEISTADTIAYNIELVDNRAYIAGEEGMHIVDLSNPASPQEIGFFNAYGRVSDIVVTGDVAYLCGGSSNNYFVIVDISDPGNPVEVNRHLNSGRNLSVDGGYAYLAEGWYGFTILDINDPYNIVEVGDFPNKVQDVIVNGDYACITEGSDGLRIWNISAPQAPVEEGYTNIGQNLSGISLNAGHIYVAGGENGLYVFKEEIPPEKPIDLQAGGSSPSLWQASPIFEVDWTNPGDLSGIRNAKYKLSSPPGSNDDFEEMVGGEPPYNIEVSEEGIHTLYLWVVDSAGNENFGNYNTVNLRYDGSCASPFNFGDTYGLETDTWQNNKNNALLSWDAPSDPAGIEKYYIYLGPDPSGTSFTDSTTEINFDLFFSEGVTYFRIQAKDNLGNTSEWTTGFIFKYDPTKPQGAQASVADSSAGSFTVSWSAGSDDGGSGLSGTYDIRYKEGEGEWSDWLINYSGDNGVFTDGAGGQTYYFEAAARDNAGNVETFVEQAECSTFVSSHLGTAITNLSGEQSGLIEIHYTISNSDSTATDIKCEYSLSAENVWDLATVTGKTTNILPVNYSSSITWDSDTDATGMDSDYVRFRITPIDITGTGIAEMTSPFHLDNNQPPTIIVDPIVVEQNEDILISYHLSDKENDTLSIRGEYFHLGSQIWLDATLMGDTEALINKDNQITWQSAVELSTALGEYQIRIRPYDNDPGISDTLTVFIDNVGAPDILSMTELTEEQSGDITINYFLADNERQTINLICEYSQDSGKTWSLASTSGSVTGITFSEYAGSLTWHSSTDLPGVDKTTVQFRLTATDGNAGRPRVTSEFHLDNNLPPTLQIGTLTSLLSGNIEIPITIDDTENDTVSVLGQYRKETGSWQSMTSSSIPLATQSDYTNTFYWDSNSDLSFGKHPQVQVQLFAVDKDMGTSALSNTFEIRNYPGDYSGDIYINSEDLHPFALAWRNQDLSKEIGPATGQPPDLIPNPDDAIDFEDLMVLLQQWNWSFDHPDHLLTKAKNGSDIQNAVTQLMIQKDEHQENIILNSSQVEPLHETFALSSVHSDLVKMEQSEYDKWANKFADQLKLNLDTTASILGFQVVMNYDPKIFTLSDLKSTIFEEQDGIIFKTDDRKHKRFLVDAFVLDSEKKLAEIDGEFMTLNIEALQEKRITSDFSWKIYQEDGTILSQGQSEIDLETHRSVPQTFSLYQNFPNPFNPSTTIRYQLPSAGKVQLTIFNILGEKVQTLVNENQNAGYYNCIWDVSESNNSIASGIYFAQLLVKGDDGNRYIDHKKIILLK